MRPALARVLIPLMAALAVFVQLAVWGATKVRADGALLESWQPYFGWPYGVVFATAQVALCRWLALDRGLVWLVRTWVVAGAVVLTARALGGVALGLDDSVALVSGLGAVVLAAGLYDGRLAPRRRAASQTRKPPGGGFTRSG